jgi:ribose-phosphate pyrophosphokinase
MLGGSEGCAETSISARLVANLITTAGASRVLAMDLHAGQIQGFFDIPVDPPVCPAGTVGISVHYPGEVVVVSPDAGGCERARKLGKSLNATLAIIDKRGKRQTCPK